MTQAILPGDPPIELALRRSARARRISLRVSSLDGRVTLSLPKHVAEAEALAFARDKEPWIRKHLSKQVDARTVEIGGTILFEGKELPIVVGAVRKAELTDGQIVVPSVPRMVPPRVKALLRNEAQRRLAVACLRYTGIVDRPLGKITLRDTRSRWGSCSSNGNLMFSWRLVMAPPEVLDYVAAHEVAHLVEMNHSAAYWAVVSRICPEYELHRDWLRRHGAMLHRYRFGD